MSSLPHSISTQNSSCLTFPRLLQFKCFSEFWLPLLEMLQGCRTQEDEVLVSILPGLWLFYLVLYQGLSSKTPQPSKIPAPTEVFGLISEVPEPGCPSDGMQVEVAEHTVL